MDQILYILHCHEVTKGIFYNERGATIEFSDKLSTLSFFGFEEMWPNIFATDLTEISGRKGLRRRGELKNRDDNFTDGLTLRQTSVESSSVPCKTTHRFKRNQIRARTQNRQFATVFGGIMSPRNRAKPFSNSYTFPPTSTRYGGFFSTAARRVDRTTKPFPKEAIRKISIHW